MSTLDIRCAARSINDSDLRQAVLDLAEDGWRAVRYTSKQHLLIEHPPTGARVSASCSPSDRHSGRVLRREARNAVLRRGHPRS